MRTSKSKKPQNEGPHKVVDEKSIIRCAAGTGEVREEVWQDESGKVVRYNLAFINHSLYAGDNGRVLGYDTAHGYAHRHFAGKVEKIKATSYNKIFERFLKEVKELKGKKSL